MQEKSDSAQQQTQHKAASEIGWLFLREYYKILCIHPTLLHKFYKKSSSFSYGIECDAVVPCVGRESIKNTVSKSFNLEGKKVILSTIDTHDSQCGGILIMVIGEIKSIEGNDPPRKFAQTFLLASQENGFYIHNDIFRYIKYDSGENWESAVEESLEYNVPVEDSAPLTVNNLFEDSSKAEASPQPSQDPSKHQEPAEVPSAGPAAMPSQANAESVQSNQPSTTSISPTSPDKLQSSGHEPRSDVATAGSSVQAAVETPEKEAPSKPTATPQPSAPQKPSYASCAATGGPSYTVAHVSQQPPPSQRKHPKKLSSNGATSQYSPGPHGPKDAHQRPPYKTYSDHHQRDDHRSPDRGTSVYLRLDGDSDITKEKLAKALSEVEGFVDLSLTPNSNRFAFAEFCDASAAKAATGKSFKYDGITITVEERKRYDKSSRGFSKPYKPSHPPRNEDSHDGHGYMKQYSQRRGSSRGPSAPYESPASPAGGSHLEPRHQDQSHKSVPRENTPTDTDKHHQLRQKRSSVPSSSKKVTA